MSDKSLPGSQDDYPRMRPGDAGVLYPAAHMAMMMTALADKFLGQSEKDALVEVFYAANRWNMSPQTVLTTLQKLVDAIALNEDHWQKLLRKHEDCQANRKLTFYERAQRWPTSTGKCGPKNGKGSTTSLPG